MFKCKAKTHIVNLIYLSTKYFARHIILITYVGVVISNIKQITNLEL